MEACRHPKCHILAQWLSMLNLLTCSEFSVRCITHCHPCYQAEQAAWLRPRPGDHLRAGCTQLRHLRLPQVPEQLWRLLSIPRVPPSPLESHLYSCAVSPRFAARFGWGGLTAHFSPKPPWCTAKSPFLSNFKTRNG